jgi:hypothetical protein
MTYTAVIRQYENLDTASMAELRWSGSVTVEADTRREAFRALDADYPMEAGYSIGVVRTANAR